MGKRHDENIEKITQILQTSGFKVFRIDKRSVPDLIVTRSEIPIPLEIQTVAIKAKVKQIVKKTSFPKTILIYAKDLYGKDAEIKLETKKGDYWIPKRWIAYLITVELNKRGLTNSVIQKIIEKELGFYIPFSSLWDWLKGDITPKHFPRELFSVDVIERN